jgi:hypothetical protein
MGTAFVKAHDFAELSPRGSRLAVDPALLVKRPQDVIISDFAGPAVVDWIHTKTAFTEHIVKTAGIDLPSASELKKMLVAYVAGAGALGRSDWGRNTLVLNNCATPEV